MDGRRDGEAHRRGFDLMPLACSVKVLPISHECQQFSPLILESAIGVGSNGTLPGSLDDMQVGTRNSRNFSTLMSFYHSHSSHPLHSQRCYAVSTR
jgi:hypothetical protein